MTVAPPPCPTLTLRRPDDWHLHLRDGAMMAAVLPDSSARFGRAIIMPNLIPPIVTTAQAAAYRDRIVARIPAGHDFRPLMTLYLTEDTAADDVSAGAEAGLIHAVKLYPAGATTNSESGVRRIERVLPVLDRMARAGLPLLVHGEVTDPAVDIFDREAVFIERVLIPLRRQVPGLRVVMEHITTAQAVDYVTAADATLAATVTVHHLIINRNAYLAGGLRPHYYCLPVAKRERHRLALRAAVTAAGQKKFFLGTDSAPHPESAKLSACGCAGIYTAANALSCLAHVFEQEQALFVSDSAPVPESGGAGSGGGRAERLEAFISLNGPAFYGLPPNDQTVTLTRADAPLAPAQKIRAGADHITVFDPGFPLHWQLV